MVPKAMPSQLRAQCELESPGSLRVSDRRPLGAALEAGLFEDICRQMHLLAGRSAELDDLVQSAAEQALRSLASFEGRAARSTWTFRICYHTLLKHQRWYRRWLRRFSLSGDDAAEAVASADPMTSDLLEQRNRSVRLRRALDSVSPKRRAVVLLHDIEELSIDEIASIVGANTGTVRSRLRDGRKMLARALARDPYFGDVACHLETP
jgi:RNA polymerase sigma-70 factor (ECF subfamily)